MSDPRYTDPRYSDPVLRREESAGGVWGWIAGLAVLALIAFMIVAGWNNNGSNTSADNRASPAVTGSSAPRPMPSTTGAGTLSPQPTTPAPAPAPAPRPAQ
jgi:uncharacterized membrane protein